MPVNRRSARKFGQTAMNPLPLSIVPRTMVAKWWIGFNTVRGCSHFGIASTGLSAPEREDIGGLMKKLVSWACCADFENVAITVPMLIPERMQRQPAKSKSRTLPWKGTPKTKRMTAQQEERGDLGDNDFGGACGRHEELLDRSRFAFADHGGGCDKGTVEDEQQAEHAGDDEPGIDQSRVEEEVGLELDLTPAGDVRCLGLLDADVDSLLLQSVVVALDHALRVGAADVGRVGVGRVEHELNGGGTLPGEVARVIVWNDNSSVGVAAADSISELIDRGVVTREPKALALGKRGDEFAALWRAAVVDHRKAHIRDGGAERESEES